MSIWRSLLVLATCGAVGQAYNVGMDRATADYMGMLATVMNALALDGCHGAHGHVYSRPVRGGNAGSS